MSRISDHSYTSNINALKDSIITGKSATTAYRIKRIIDIFGASFGIFLLIPLLFFVYFAIRLTSKGPVFFSQTRVGIGGSLFRMYKFRSMRVDAEKQRESLEGQNQLLGPAFKMKNDPRVTTVGRFIRKHSIDELPQLWNVLRGDMSLVGPRPPLPTEVEKYEEWQMERLKVRPGLTCIWQVSGRNHVGFEEWMRMDLEYIRQWSLWLDLKLIFKTFRAVFTGNGAY